MGQALHCRYMAVTKPLRYDQVTYTHVSAPEFHEDSKTVLKSTWIHMLEKLFAKNRKLP